MTPAAARHSVVAADTYCVPAPFRAFAVRSDEPQHAYEARAPSGRVHVVRTTFLDARSLARLAAEGRARMDLLAFPDIEYAHTRWQELAAATPHVADLAGQVAAALQLTGLLGDDAADCRRQVHTRVDHLGCCGAGFHNDVSRHWSRCLFWILALQVGDVEFVMPHAGLRLALAPGDLLAFDPALAHGLCRPRDLGQALAASFETGANDQQFFLTGELQLTDERWAALGSPWLPVEEHEHRGALDLLVASFDERSGAIQRLSTLQGGMRRSVCHADVPHVG